MPNTYFRVKHTKISGQVGATERDHAEVKEGDIVTLDEIKQMGANPHRLLRLKAIEAMYDDEGKDRYDSQGGTRLAQDRDPDADFEEEETISRAVPTGDVLTATEIETPRGPVKPIEIVDLGAADAETPAVVVQTPDSATGSATEPGPGDVPTVTADNLASTPGDGYENKNVEELRAVASMLGVEKASNLSKKDLIAAIRKAEG